MSDRPALPFDATRSALESSSEEPTTRSCNDDGSTYPWERYWVKSGTIVRMDFSGFLLDPSSTYGRALAGEPLLLPDLLGQPLLALEGDAGLGKSTAIRDAVQSAHATGRDVLYHAAGTFPTVEALRNAIDGRR